MNIGGHPLRSMKDSFGGSMSCSSIIEATFMAGCFSGQSDSSLTTA